MEEGTKEVLPKEELPDTDDDRDIDIDNDDTKEIPDGNDVDLDRAE